MWEINSCEMAVCASIWWIWWQNTARRWLPLVLDNMSSLVTLWFFLSACQVHRKIVTTFSTHSAASSLTALRNCLLSLKRSSSWLVHCCPIWWVTRNYKCMLVSCAVWVHGLEHQDLIWGNSRSDPVSNARQGCSLCVAPDHSALFAYEWISGYIFKEIIRVFVKKAH